MAAWQIPDPSLILLIGPAGAGKSTFAARHFAPTEILSSDRIRGMICDDEANQAVSGDAFAALRHLARLRLNWGCLTVIDATNLDARARRPFLRMARRLGRPVIAIVFQVSLETCLTQNRGRTARMVEETVIRRHADGLHKLLPRLAQEGYHRIYLLHEANRESILLERN